MIDHLPAKAQLLMVNGMSGIAPLAWPVSRLGEAVEVLARKRKLLAKTIDTPNSFPPLASTDNEVLEERIDLVARQLDIEAEAVETSYFEIDQFLRNAHPALLRLPGAVDTDEPRFLLLFKGGWWGLSVIAPDLKVHRVSRQQVRDALCDGLEQPIRDHLTTVWAEWEEAEHQRNQSQKPLAREIMLQTGLGTARVGEGWLLRLRPGVPLLRQARHEYIIQPLLITLGAIMLWQILELGSWGIIGVATFQGHIDRGWFLAWGLALFSVVFCKMVLYDYQFRFLTNFMKIFKTKLFYGTLRFKPDEVRLQGTGQFLSRIMDSEMVEGVTLFEGVEIVTQLILLLLTGVVLTFGSGGWWHTLLLLGWVCLVVLICWRYLRIGKSWIRIYREMSQDLVEHMIGHRTRLVQENPEHWHADEDQMLERYLRLSLSVNRLEMLLTAFIPRGWLVISLAGLVYPLMNGTTSLIPLVLSLGGILFAFQAFTNLTTSLSDVLRARLAQDQNEPILQAAARPIETPRSIQSSRLKRKKEAEPFLVVRDMGFRYAEHLQPVLQACNLQINTGDRLLLEGPSGSGKSTLAAILGGLYIPRTGMILLQGLDHQTVGHDTLRRQVVIVPQFQENHIFTETFGFNLLMGHRWPPLPEDLAEAETICRELGLGHLLDQMPDGFEQPVGDSGWLLSHGECSRLYIARALLQKPQFLILDESFGSLDPEALQISMECVLKRVSTLLVIAHP